MKKVLYPVWGKEVSEQELEELLKKLYISLKLMDSVLSKQDYLVLKDKPTIADICLVSEAIDTMLDPEMIKHLEKFENVKKWIDRMLEIKELKTEFSYVLEQIEDVKEDMKAKL